MNLIPRLPRVPAAWAAASLVVGACAHVPPPPDALLTLQVRPAAVIAFTPEGVEVLTIPAQPGPFDKLVERVPAVVDMVERARQALG